MAVIDPEGLYYGDRLSRLSLMARLYWPYIYLLCNGYGRFEINYPKNISKAFSGFPSVPTEQEFRSYIREYFKADLLFVYRANSQLWGQWDTPKKFLPRHKTKADEASPIPPTEAYQNWLSAYHAKKQHESSAISVEDEDLEDFAENCENSAEDFVKDARVIGEVIGVVIGGYPPKPPASDDPVPSDAVDATSDAGVSGKSTAIVRAMDGDRNFQRMMGVFYAFGKCLSEQQLMKVCRKFLSLSEGNQQAAADFAEEQGQGEWLTRKTQHIPNPGNYIDDQPWNARGRDSPGRVIPRLTKREVEIEQASRLLGMES